MRSTRVIDKIWRVPATGFGFALLGVGGTLMACIHALIILPLPIKVRLKRHVGRGSIRLAFYIYLRILRTLSLIHFDIHNADGLKTKGAIIIANHPSLLDVVFLGSMVNKANCIVKSSLWKNPMTAGPVRVAGYIPNDNQQLIDNCLNALEAGDNLIIFPEGTRTTPEHTLHFQRGLAYLIMAAKDTPVVPVIIDCFPATLIKGEKWYTVPERKAHFRLWVDEPLQLRGVVEDEAPKTRQVRQLTRHLEQYFARRIDEQTLPLKRA